MVKNEEKSCSTYLQPIYTWHCRYPKPGFQVLESPLSNELKASCFHHFLQSIHHYDTKSLQWLLSNEKPLAAAVGSSVGHNDSLKWLEENHYPLLAELSLVIRNNY